MKQSNYLPEFVGISLSKAEFCYCTGCTPYLLRKICRENYVQLVKRGYTKFAKLLMPSVVLYLCDITGYRIDLDLYYQIRR